MTFDLGKIDVATLILGHNPFAFMTRTGDMAYFNTYTDVYEDLIRRLQKQFCKGYIDMVLFLVDHCGLPSLEAEQYVRRMQWKHGIHDPCVLDWMEGGEERDTMLRKIATGLHDMTETVFDRRCFEEALDIWKEKNNIDKQNDNS